MKKSKKNLNPPTKYINLKKTQEPIKEFAISMSNQSLNSSFNQSKFKSPQGHIYKQKNINSNLIKKKQSKTYNSQQFKLQPKQYISIKFDSTDLVTVGIKQKSSNIKTYARFRPINQMEKQLTQQNIGSICTNFLSETQVSVSKQNVVFTFDKVTFYNQVFKPETSQQTVFSEVGSTMIEEIFNGYNGTIFAYGATGSGKTYSMFGNNLIQSKMQGIIPRAIHKIFQKIQQEEDSEKQFVIIASMLQLYKETLYDLITGQRDKLKIKENPIKGIYVQNLAQIAITSESQFMDVVINANKNKTVRSTKVNQLSSRSHTLFIVSINQRKIYGEQCRGKLNLIDLAGSQKLSKSGSVGQSLEQAKKINLSLSCLGNVIHALTSNADHIPYRDSKLTRLLQQSLGGNYKTSLIATCSMHQSSLQQTISTLKFATRAKTIKNHFKMNIIASNVGLKILIQMLKSQNADLNLLIRKLNTQMDKLKEEIRRLGIKIPLFDQICKWSAKIDKNPEGKKPFSIDIAELENAALVRNIGYQLIKQIQFINTIVYFYKRQLNQYHYFDSDKEYASQLMKSAENIRIIDNHSLEYREIKQKEIIIFQKNNNIIQLKKQLLVTQKKYADMIYQKNAIQNKYNKLMNNIQYANFQIAVFQKQIEELIQNIYRLENQNKSLMLHNAHILDSKFNQFIKSTFKFTQITLPLYFNFKQKLNDKSVNRIEQLKNFMQNQTQVSIQKKTKIFFQNQNLTYSQRSIDKSANQISLLGKIDYIQNTFKDKPKEGIIFYLKKDLINAHIINQHLKSLVSSLEWKYVIEKGKSKIKSNLIEVQSLFVQSLERILEQISVNYKNQRQRIQQIEYELMSVKSKQYQQTKQHNLKLVVPIKNNTQNNLQNIKDIKNSHMLQDFQIEKLHPNLKKIKQRITDIENEIIPLTYQKAIKMLSSKKQFIKQIWQEISKVFLFHQGQLFKLAKQKQTNNIMAKQIKQYKIENQRLQAKVITLLSQLKVQSLKAENYSKVINFYKAYIVLQQNIENLKYLSLKMQNLMNLNIEESNSNWQKTFHEIREINKKEFKREQDQRNQILIEVKNFMMKVLSGMKMARNNNKEVLQNLIFQTQKWQRYIDKVGILQLILFQQI